MLCAAVVLVIGGYAISQPLHDFVEYWTAAHRLVAHQNPYSISETFQMQKALGWEEPVPLIPLNPPWTLTLFAPLGLFKSYSLAWLTWVGLLAFALAFASRILMDLYFGDLRLQDISDTVIYRCLFAFTFYPVLLSLKFAQIDALLLLGIAGFLYFESKDKPILGGVLLSLTAFKPQLIYLVWLAVLLRSLQARSWRTLASMATVIALLMTVAWSLDPRVIRQYWSLTNGPYGQIYPSGIVAVVRRMFGGQNTFWLQLLPSLFGVTWFAIYWRKYRHDWNWVERMPALVTASLLTSAWGWLFDQALLAVPIISLAAFHARKEDRLPRTLIAIYTVLNVLLLLAAMASSPWAFLPAPVLMVVLLLRAEHTEGAPFTSRTIAAATSNQQ
jgi:Glycosyltransferase family 87